MTDRGPNIIHSGLGVVVTGQGVTVELSIHRFEDRSDWAMEFINQNSTSTVWGELFETDDADFAELRRVDDDEVSMMMRSKQRNRYPA